MPIRPALPTTAVAGALAIGASLLGFAVSSQTPEPQTRAVALTAGDTELLAPDIALIGSAVPAEVVGYTFADFTRAIQDTVAAGDQQFTAATAAFSDGQYPLALSHELAGFNDLTTGVSNDVLTNGYAVLTNSDGNAGYAFENPGQPVDFATGLSEAHTFLADGQTDFTTALAEFGAGDNYFGLVSLADIGTESNNATDALILGLFDQLIGAGASA